MMIALGPAPFGDTAPTVEWGGSCRSGTPDRARTFNLRLRRYALRLGCRLVQSGVTASMPSSARPLRQSVTLSAGVARRVRSLARGKRASTSRVIAELVESGLQAQDSQRERFLQLADRLTKSKDNAEQERIKEELARLTFGD